MRSSSIARCSQGALLWVVAAALIARGSVAHAADSISPDRFAVNASGQVLEIPIESSRPLRTFDATVERIVVVVHGSSQNAGDYRRRVEAAAAMRPGEAARTLVVAPQFLEESDIVRFGLPARTLFWSSGWRTGSLSLDTTGHPRPARISSYAVIDQLLDALIQPSLFPNLTTVVVAGHSAGGQFAHRFAAGTPAVDRHAGVAFRFVVANPGSYLYLSPERAVSGAAGTFATPTASQQSACSSWNDYKYGLRNLNSYMEAAGASQIVARYGRREVEYLLGAEDTGSVDLDTSCAAMLMGADRFERGSVYFAYLQHFYGPSILDHHHMAVVSGVGHDSGDVFQSDEGLVALFGSGAQPSPPPPQPLGPPGKPYILW